MRAPPVTNHYPLVGTAFDYFLRFDIQRQYPHVISQTWVAQHGVAILASFERTAGRKQGPASLFRIVGGADGLAFAPKSLARHAKESRGILAAAKKEVEKYCATSAPTLSEKTEVAGHAIRLAKLDGLYRRHELDVTMGSVDEGDVQDLLRLLEIVPFDQLDRYMRGAPVLLNPTFGTYSKVVGGADADMVASGLVLDFKTTKYPDFAKSLPQIVGYAILADLHRGEDPSFPEPREVGIYFARHGVVKTVSYVDIRSHADFASARDAFIQVANKDYGHVPGARAVRVTKRKAPRGRSRQRHETKRKR